MFSQTDPTERAHISGGGGDLLELILLLFFLSGVFKVLMDKVGDELRTVQKNVHTASYR